MLKFRWWLFFRSRRATVVTLLVAGVVLVVAFALGRRMAAQPPGSPAPLP